MLAERIANQFLANPFEALGLEWQSILLHLFNLIVLTVGLYFLLFKPVKRMIRERREKIANIEKENAELSAEVRQMKESGEKVLAEAKQEAAQIRASAQKEAMRKADEIIGTARDQARGMIEQTERSLGQERRKLQKDIEREIADVSVLVAEKVIEKNISGEDNKKLIAESIEEWSKQEHEEQ